MKIYFETKTFASSLRGKEGVSSKLLSIISMTCFSPFISASTIACGSCTKHSAFG